MRNSWSLHPRKKCLVFWSSLGPGLILWNHSTSCWDHKNCFQDILHSTYNLGDCFLYLCSRWNRCMTQLLCSWWLFSLSILQVTQLVDLCAKVVAKHFPFEAVEEYKPPIPEQIQLKISYWSFPQCEDDIQLYSCLAHGTMDEFQKAELIMKLNNVKDVFQIGMIQYFYSTFR